MKINKWEQIHNLESNTRLVCKIAESSLPDNYHVDILVDGLQETSFELYRGDNLGDCVYLLNKIGFIVEYDRPFDLIEFLIKYIKPVDIIQDNLNCCFLFNCCFLVNNNGEISVQKSVTNKVVGGFYFDVRYIEAYLKLEAILHHNKVTSEQLEGALKELNWIQ